MYKLWIATYKEFLLLKRDLGGLAVLFIMPLVLLITVTLIQNSSFVGASDVKISVILIDNDKGELSSSIIENLHKNDSFEIVRTIDGKAVTEELANDLVLKGTYQMAIVIPENLTKNLNIKVSQNVSKILEELGVEEEIAEDKPEISSQQIRMYFDPAAHSSLKNGIKNSIDKMVSKLETEAVYKAFQDELEIENVSFNTSDLFSFKEMNPVKNDVAIKPNSVQHNVPAWALFAIFFIIIPLSINVVAEKNQGTFVRLKTSPISYATSIFGKVFVYLAVCLLQFLLMMLVGFYIFPYLA